MRELSIPSAIQMEVNRKLEKIRLVNECLDTLSIRLDEVRSRLYDVHDTTDQMIVDMEDDSCSDEQFERTLEEHEDAGYDLDDGWYDFMSAVVDFTDTVKEMNDA